MITEELIGYIKKQLAAGHSEATVKKILLDHKWKESDVEEALKTSGVISTAPMDGAVTTAPAAAAKSATEGGGLGYFARERAGSEKPVSAASSTAPAAASPVMPPEINALLRRVEALESELHAERQMNAKRAAPAASAAGAAPFFASADFYQSLKKTISPENEPLLPPIQSRVASASQTGESKKEIPISRPAPNFAPTVAKSPAQENTVARSVGDPLLRPKTFGVAQMDVTPYQKSFTPRERPMPAASEEILPAISKKPDHVSIAEATEKISPASLAPQADRFANITVTPPQKPKHSFKKLIFIALSIAAILGGVSLYFYFKGAPAGSGGNFSIISPLSQIRSANYEISITGPILLSFFDVAQDFDPNTLSLLIKAEGNYALGTNALSRYEIILNNKDSYKVISSPAASYISIDDPRTEAVDEIWVALPGGFIQTAIHGILGGGAGNILTSSHGQALPAGTKEKITSRFLSSSLVKITYKGEKENINGESLPTYSFEIDEMEMNALFAEIIDLGAGSSGYEEALTDIRNTISSMKFSQGKVSLSRNLPVRLSATIAPPLSSEESSQLVINVNSYNNNPTINLPSPIITLEEVMSAAGMAGTENPAKSAIEEAGHRAEAFKSIKKSYSGVCQDPEVAAGMTVLEEMTGQAVTCKGSSLSYVIGINSGMPRLCVDAKGEVKESGIAESKYECN